MWHESEGLKNVAISLGFFNFPPHLAERNRGTFSMHQRKPMDYACIQIESSELGDILLSHYSILAISDRPLLTLIGLLIDQAASRKVSLTPSPSDLIFNLAVHISSVTT